MKTAKQIALDAATYLETKGWTPYLANGVNGSPCCLVQAITRVTVIGQRTERNRLLDLIESRLNGLGIGRWNDSQESAAPVIALLREVAEAL